MAQALALPGPTLLVADPDTWAAAGAPTEQSLAAHGVDFRRLIIGRHPVAGPESIAALTGQLGDAASLVAVGSGTVNDIVKSTAHGRGLPYLAVGTALSMNGYTSAISALLDGGVKRTVTATPPIGVVIDLDICAAAPLAMTLAGLGDMLSKPFSEADWRLAHHVDGGYHCEVPGNVLGAEFTRMLDDAAGIGHADPDALGSLAESILLSGISMAMAGVSSPASGGEHLISHYWDMLCYGRGEHPYALHGTQVGVACCMIEPLHHAVQALATESPDLEAALARWPATEAECADRVRARHPSLPEDVVENVILEAVKKWRPRAEQRERLSRFLSNKEEVLAHVGQALLPAGAVLGALERARAPIAPHQVHPNLKGTMTDWMHVRDMRARYSVLDLASELGVGGQ